MAAEDCELLGRDGNVYKGQPQADDVAGALRSVLAGAVRPTPPALPLRWCAASACVRLS